jgi:hypothetical protein
MSLGPEKTMLDPGPNATNLFTTVIYYCSQ